MEAVVNEEAVKAVDAVQQEAPKVVEKAAEVVTKHPNDVLRVIKYSGTGLVVLLAGYGVYELQKGVRSKVRTKKSKKGDKKKEEPKEAEEAN